MMCMSLPAVGEISNVLGCCFGMLFLDKQLPGQESGLEGLSYQLDDLQKG